MRTPRLRSHLLIVALLAASPADIAAQTSEPLGGASDEVRITLALEGDRQVFRMGEPIRATLTFESADLRVLTNPFVASDEWRFTPTTPVSFWRDRYGDIFGEGDVTTRARGTGQIAIEFTLGDRVRFDAPGTYSLTIASGRANNARGTSNTISFQVLPMGEGETTSEIARLNAALDGLPASADARSRDVVFERLASLEGDAATREHVRRILERPLDSRRDAVRKALFRSADASLAIALLEEAVRDVEVVPSTSVLGTLVNLRLWQSGPAEALARDLDAFALLGQADLAREYAQAIIASLPGRSAENQRDTALMLLELSWAVDIPSAVTDIILDQLDSLDASVRERVIARRWDVLGNANLVHELTALLDRATDEFDRTELLAHLIEISPDLARPYVFREMAEVESTVHESVLMRLPDATLPEFDDLLLVVVEDRPDERDYGPAFRAAALLSRYGSPAAFQRGLAAYDRLAHVQPGYARAGLLAYLARWNEPVALARLDAAVPPAADRVPYDLLAGVAALYYSPAIEALLVARLDADSAEPVRRAAFLLGERGSAAGGDALRRRLDRWHAERLDAARAGIPDPDLDEHFDPTVQTALVEALAREHAWRLSPGEVEAIRRNCVSARCVRAVSER